MNLDQQFNDLREYIKEQVRQNPEHAKEAVMLNAALSILEVALADLDRIATAMERIADTTVEDSRGGRFLRITQPGWVQK